VGSIGGICKMPIEDHPYHIPIEGDAVLWRYIDLEKFESLLIRKALFFCRADKFSDPFEGSIPRKEANYRMIWQKIFSQENKQSFDEELALKSINNLSMMHLRLKRCTVVNCWQINNNESDAMWRLYLKDNEGVAIQTTTKRLTNSLNSSNIKIGLSRVRYIDYDNEIWYHKKNFPHHSYNAIVPFIHKRIEFSHENELRLYHLIYDAEHDMEYWDRQENHKGVFVEIDINELVDKIILPPTADEQVKNRILQLAEKYGYKFEFLNSKLQNNPIF
jgi:hypothetical protein